jgi:hypothetical protein
VAWQGMSRDHSQAPLTNEIDVDPRHRDLVDDKTPPLRGPFRQSLQNGDSSSRIVNGDHGRSGASSVVTSFPSKRPFTFAFSSPKESFAFQRGGTLMGG